MRSVERVPFSEYFKSRALGEFEDLEPTSFYLFFYKRSQYFNKLSFALVILLFSAAIAPFSREGLVGFLSISLFLAYSFFRARRSAQGIYINRVFQPRITERRYLEVTYEVRNAGGFSVSDFLISDLFTGSVQFNARIAVAEDIPAYRVRKVAHAFPCDSGMGVHHFGPLSAVVTDPLGIFRFVVRDDASPSVEVTPEFITLGEFAPPSSVESASIGQNETTRQGQSVTFHGVREYRLGDPLNRINWRLSARHRELIVNEFESSISTDLTVYLDLDPQNQIGRRAESTWEYLKDILVSLLHHRMEGVSQVQLISQDLALPFGTGSDHLHWLISKVSRLEGTRVGGRIPPKAIESIPYGSSLLYLSSVYQNDPKKLVALFESLQERAVSITAVLVEGRSFLTGLDADPFVMSQILQQRSMSEKVLDRILENNSRLGVRTFVVTRQGDAASSISRSMVNART